MTSAPAIAVPAARSGRNLARYLPFVLFLVALLPGLYEFRHSAFGFGRGFELASIARTLVQEGTFGNPDLPAITGPTAANPPLYPLMLAALMRLFGEPGWVVAANFANILINAWIAILMPVLASVLYGDRRPGLYAAALWILAMRLMPQWDTSCTILGLMLFVVVTAGGEARWRPIAGGIIGGLTTLLNPSTLLVLLPWIAYVLLKRRSARWDALRYAATVLLLVGLCNVPWVIRNYRIWHTPVLRTNFGMALYSSNNPCARSTLYENTRAGCIQLTHPVASPSEIRLLQTLGEVEYDRRRTADGLEWIRSNPQAFWRLTRARIFEFWFTDLDMAPRAAYAIWLITLLSIPGIVRMARRRELATPFILAVWLLYPLMFYVVNSCDRYRFPILWTSMLPAGYWIASLVAPGTPARFRAGEMS
jgi:hypothetical protein